MLLGTKIELIKFIISQVSINENEIMNNLDFFLLDKLTKVKPKLKIKIQNS